MKDCNIFSISSPLDPELATNTRKWEARAAVRKGEYLYFGEFNMGSTILLIFEALWDFVFNFVSEGDTVRVGRSVMNVKEVSCPVV